MDRTLSNFIRALRNAEVRVSTAETLDAFNTVELVGYRDRNFLKSALSMVLPKTADEKETFEDCFEQFFSFKTFANDSRAANEGGEPADEGGAAHDETGEAAPEGERPGEREPGGGGGTLRRGTRPGRPGFDPSVTREKFQPEFTESLFAPYRPQRLLIEGARPAASISR